MTAMASLRILPEFRRYAVSLIALILLWSYGHWLCQTFLVNVDMAALLGLARHYDLTTYRYGREVWEINPPLILLMLKLPIWLENISAKPAYWWATQLVMTQLWLSGLALRFGLARINAGKPAPTKASAALPAWLVIALWLGLAAGDITERDTLMAIALAPLLVAMLPVLGSVHYRMNRQEVAVHRLLWVGGGLFGFAQASVLCGACFFDAVARAISQGLCSKLVGLFCRRVGCGRTLWGRAFLQRLDEFLSANAGKLHNSGDAVGASASHIAMASVTGSNRLCCVVEFEVLPI
jgi:hypothetical protein